MTLLAESVAASASAKIRAAGWWTVTLRLDPRAAPPPTPSRAVAMATPVRAAARCFIFSPSRIDHVRSAETSLCRPTSETRRSGPLTGTDMPVIWLIGARTGRTRRSHSVALPAARHCTPTCHVHAVGRGARPGPPLNRAARRGQRPPGTAVVRWWACRPARAPRSAPCARASHRRSRWPSPALSASVSTTARSGLPGPLSATPWRSRWATSASSSSQAPRVSSARARSPPRSAPGSAGRGRSPPPGHSVRAPSRATPPPRTPRSCCSPPPWSASPQATSSPGCSPTSPSQRGHGA